jgi:hypothetical protein
MPPELDVRQFIFASHPRRLQRLARGPVQALLLCALVLTGCATKSPKPPPTPTPQTVAAQPQRAQPKAKQPFLVGAFSWLKYVPTFSSRKPKPPPAQVPRLIGVVKMVDRDDRFVLIDAATLQGATAGDLLVCIRDQKETANLRMGNLKNPPFLIADIASGNPSPGDRVFKP